MLRLPAIVGIAAALMACGGSRIPAPAHPVKPEVHGWYAIVLAEGLLKPSDPRGKNWDGPSPEAIRLGAAVAGGILAPFTGGSSLGLVALAAAGGIAAATPLLAEMAGRWIAPDPYAVLRIADAELQTAPIRNNHYALWNCVFMVHLSRDDDHHLEIEVWDHDPGIFSGREDFAGAITVPLEDLLEGHSTLTQVGPFDSVAGVSLTAYRVADYDADEPPVPGDLSLPDDGSVSLILRRAHVGGAVSYGTALDRTMRSRLDAVGECYDEALRDSPKLRGSITAKMVVGDEGHAERVKIRRDSVGSAMLSECLKDLIERWDYPVPEHRARFVYTFVFDPGGGKLTGGDVRSGIHDPFDDD